LHIPARGPGRVCDGDTGRQYCQSIRSGCVALRQVGIQRHLRQGIDIRQRGILRLALQAHGQRERLAALALGREKGFGKDLGYSQGIREVDIAGCERLWKVRFTLFEKFSQQSLMDPQPVCCSLDGGNAVRTACCRVGIGHVQAGAQVAFDGNQRIGG